VNTNRRYSIAKEIEYYATSSCDRDALPYGHLSAYFKGSVGTDFFVGKKVLDLGCGEGVYSAWIADTGKAESVLGVELTNHRIRTEYSHQTSNLQFLCGDIFKVPIKPHNFDVVFMNLVLHHVRFDLSEVISSIKSCLHPRGSFLAFEPNVYSPLALAAHLYHDRSANEGFLSPRKIRDEFLKAGFTKVDHGFFWRNRRWAQNPLLGSSFWIRAELS
jgi:2-polyprenyl-3-methyl-5-hydroxy-6-metoxy-1,4-benzoquinol methylase